MQEWYKLSIVNLTTFCYSEFESVAPFIADSAIIESSIITRTFPHF